MEYTTNYQLNQWDAQDAIKRTDFNADNAKIDAALARVEGMASTAPVLLATAQLESEAHTLTMDVSHIDLSQYDELRLIVYSYGVSQDRVCGLQFNGVNSNSQYCYYNGSTSSNADYILIGHSQKYGTGNSVIDIQLYNTQDRLLLISHGVGCNDTNLTATRYWGGTSFCSFTSLNSLTILHGIDNENFAIGTHMVLLGNKYTM